MAPRFALPGFSTPNAPNEEARLTFTAGGTLEITFLSGVSKDDRPRAFEFFISIERGPFTRLLFVDRTNHFVIVKDNPQGGMDYVLKIFPDQLQFAVDTFAVQVMENGREIFKKSLSVKNSPLVQPEPCV